MALRTTRAFSACALLIALCVAPAGATGNFASVKGRILDTAGGPLALVAVTLSCRSSRPATSFTGEDGTFQFPGVKSRMPCTLAAADPGFLRVEYQGLELAPGEEREFDFRLKRPDERDVVVLSSRDPFPPGEMIRAFTASVGLPVRVVDLDAAGDPAATVRAVILEHPSLIVGTGLRAARVIRREVRDIPVILTLVTDPRRHDLESAVTCFLASSPGPADLLDRVVRVLPDARRIGLVYDAETSALLARDLREAAAKAGLSVVLRPIHNPRQILADLDRLRGRIDALVALNDDLAVSSRARDVMSAWAVRNGIPLAVPDPLWVEGGALFSYGATPEKAGEEAAALASRLLFGDRHPEEIGLEPTRGYVLAVNERAAESLGVVLPAGVIPDRTY